VYSKFLFKQACILASISILVGTASSNAVFAANINCNGTADCIGTLGSDNMQGDGAGNKIFGDAAFSGGSGAADNIASGGGADVIHAQGGSDKVNAGSGDDEVHAGNGNDMVSGGIGNDFCLDGDDGSDAISGGEGNDCINGEGNFPIAGADTLVGSSGDDDVSAFQHHSTSPDGQQDKIDCGDGFDSAWFNTSTDHDIVASNCEDRHTS
jgi:Ca2+-binding RTX toxin-like protein